MKKKDIPEHDLTRIRGIGEARQRILRHTFNISHYDELAKLDIDKALSLFQKKSEAVSREMLETWVKEANRLNTELINSAYLIASSYAIKTPEYENGWQAFATFVVDYQSKSNEAGEKQYRTTAHHIQTDSTKTWEDLDKYNYPQWINQGLTDTGLIKTEKNNQHRYSASIQKVSFIHFQGKPTTTHKDKNIIIESSVLDKIELQLLISKQPIDAHELNNVTCLIKCMAQKQGENSLEEFHQTSPLWPAEEAGHYLAYIEHISLKPGNYKLWFSIVLNSPHAIPDLIELPDVSVKKGN